MPSIRVNKNLNSGKYFLTFTVKNWYYLFDRYNRWDILASTLNFYKNNRKIKLLSFIFMLNHLHLIIYSDDVAGFIRDFKKYTSNQVQKNLEVTEPRVLQLFVTSNKTFEFWEKTNMPVMLETNKFFLQKQRYIEANPVTKNYVMMPEDWYWSSANEMCELKVDKLDE